MSRIVYSTDPEPVAACPRCGHTPCICNSIDLPRAQQTAYLRRDRRRRRGKTVILISGLQHTPEGFRELLSILKTHCGAGGTLRDGELEIQGDQRDRIAEKLKDLGYKVKLAGG